MNLISTNVISLYISKESQQQLHEERKREREEGEKQTNTSNWHSLVSEIL